MKRALRPKTEWKNSTEWSDTFLRRMLSWVCRELELPRKFLRKVEFGNRTDCAWSGRAWSAYGEILVRVGPARFFPRESYTHGRGTDKFTIGTIADRVEALIKVTAHEAAHCDNARLGNRSRGNGCSRSDGGSERLTDRRAKYVLEAFRLKRDELLTEWSKPTQRQEAAAARKSEHPIAKRADHAAAMARKWERRLKSAHRTLKKWKAKVAYYERKYPGGVYPESTGRERKPVVLSPEKALRRKLSKYLSLVAKEHGLRVNTVEVWDFRDSLTRKEDQEWAGDFTTFSDARQRVQLGDELELQGYGRYSCEVQEVVPIPPDEATLDQCLERGVLYTKRQARLSAATSSGS